MDLVQSIQQQLHDLRGQRSELSGIDANLPPNEIVYTMIADMMNMLETLFVMLNLPSDGFVSLTQGSQEDVGANEEASTS